MQIFKVEDLLECNKHQKKTRESSKGNVEKTAFWNRLHPTCSLMFFYFILYEKMPIAFITYVIDVKYINTRDSNRWFHFFIKVNPK